MFSLLIKSTKRNWTDLVAKAANVALQGPALFRAHGWFVKVGESMLRVSQRWKGIAEGLFRLFKARRG